jgi:hypothetical protein
MEVNGRIWGSLGLAVRCGMDFPAKLADLYLHRAGPHSAIDTRYAVGVCSRELGLELDWIEAVLRRRELPPHGALPSRRSAVRAAAQIVRPGCGYDLWARARDDPMPAARDLGRIARRSVLRLRRGTSQVLPVRRGVEDTIDLRADPASGSTNLASRSPGRQ